MEYIAVYLRLSMEDIDAGESNSISNQRKLISEYIKHHLEFQKYETVEYCDDGYTGTNMERPGMQAMLAAVKKKKIQCIIVKDISRFSRDYIETGTYLNQIFPFMGVRFIAINDHYDSKEHSGKTIEIDTAFQTLLYDLYSKDISTKVKTSLENKCANGEFAFGQVPFGYEKSRDGKNAVVVNEKEAEIVRYIFSLALRGKSGVQIARQLYEEGIPTVKQLRGVRESATELKVQTWSAPVVRDILNNRFYLGEMAYGKTVMEAVGSKKKKRLPKDEWKVVKNHHEALVSKEIYEKVSSFRPQHSTQRKREKHPLTGVIYCGGCGYSLNYKPIQAKNKYRRFECRKHSLLQIPDCCTYINATVLEEIVLVMLNKELILLGDAMRERSVWMTSHLKAVDALKKLKADYQEQMKSIQAQKDNLYEEYAIQRMRGEYTMTAQEYSEHAKVLVEQKSILENKIEQIAEKLERVESEAQNVEEDMKKIIRYSHIETLSQEVVDTFIKKVYVYKSKKVEIEWTFHFDYASINAAAT